MKNKILNIALVLIAVANLFFFAQPYYQQYQSKQKYTVQFPEPKQYPRQEMDWKQPVLSSNVWKISKLGQPDSYLLGTYHAGEAHLKIHPQVKQLLQKNQKLMLESNTDLTEDEQKTMLYSLLLNIHGKKPLLKEQMGKEDFDKVANKMRQFPNGDVMAKSLNDYYGWSALILTATLRDGLTPQTGVDSLVKQQSQQLKQPIGYLETVNESLLYFRLLPDDLAIAALKDWASTPVHTEEDKKLYFAYKNGQFKDLAPLILQELMDTSDTHLSAKQQEQVLDWFVHDLLIARTRNWLPTMQQEMAKQSTVFAVGIGHLMGNQGLITLLREQGYTITPEPKMLIWQ